MPCGRTDDLWRQIAVFPGTGKAESHRHDGDLIRIIESLPADSHPAAQAVAAGIIERNAGFMHFAPRRLADNEYPRISRRLYHRPWPQGKISLAYSAGSDSGKDFHDFFSH